MAVGSESVGCCCCCHYDIGHTLGTGELLYRRIQLQGLYTSRVTSSSPNFLNYRVIITLYFSSKGRACIFLGSHSPSVLPWSVCLPYNILFPQSPAYRCAQRGHPPMLAH